MRREKNLAEAKVELKAVNPMNAFNLLQDLRHLIILDFRAAEEYNLSHIRKSIRVDESSYKEKVAGCIVSLHEKTRPGNTLPE
jgi:predicted sulfurtransferase